MLQRWTHHISVATPYPLALQGSATLIICAALASALVAAGDERSQATTWRVLLSIAVLIAQVGALWLVPANRLPRWLQLLYLVAQTGGVAAAQMLASPPLINYVYLAIIFQAIHLFPLWLWITFSVGVWLFWSGTLIIASANLLAWLQNNLIIAFPATCLLVAAIVNARQRNRSDGAQHMLDRMRQRYDALRMTLNDLPQRAASEERLRLARTITGEIQTALDRTEQHLSTAIGQTQSNLARLQSTVAQARASVSAATERMRAAVAALRQPGFAPRDPAPLDQPFVRAPDPPDDGAFAARIPALPLPAFAWILPLVFLGAALALILLQSFELQSSERLDALWKAALFGGALTLIHILVQRFDHILWLLVALAGQALAILALVILSQTPPLLLGLLLVIWQTAQRLPTWQSLVFLAVLQPPAALATLRLTPTFSEGGAMLLIVGVSSVAVASLLLIARRQYQKRQQAEQQLAQLNSLTAELELQTTQVRTLAITAERTRLAREIHDDLGSQLMLISLQLQLVEELIAEDPPAAVAHLETTREQLHGAWRSLHTTIDAQQDPEGVALPEALRRLVDQRHTNTDQHIALQIEGRIDDLSPDIASAVYRTVQEGLTNARKHAGARRVDVRIEREASWINVTIYNDGKYTSATAQARTAAITFPSGFGLVGLHERAALLGGEISACAQPDGGFTLRLTAPLSACPKQAS